MECLLHTDGAESDLRDSAARIAADLGVDLSTAEIRRADTVVQPASSAA